MRFVEIISKKKFALISIFLFLYVSLNLFVGERGLISYYENQKIRKELIQKKNKLIFDLNAVEKVNNLLTSELDIDYLEILYRQKFMLGKSNEKVYTNIK
tara:strand:- start:234 stop:533 length:300 start_codon:yes stop_codon:yes gene_type:complete